MAKQEFLYIRAWDRMMGSAHYWTHEVIERARRENAPETAIYHSGGWAGPGRWVTYEEVTNFETRRVIDNFIADLKRGVPIAQTVPHI